MFFTVAVKKGGKTALDTKALLNIKFHKIIPTLVLVTFSDISYSIFFLQILIVTH